MKITLALITLTLALTPALPQKTPPPPGPARPLNVPKTIGKDLSNGWRVVLAQLPNGPRLAPIVPCRSATSASDRKARRGIAQIAASGANEGTGTRSSRHLNEELRSIGGSLS